MSSSNEAALPLATAARSWNWHGLSQRNSESSNDKLPSSCAIRSNGERKPTPLLLNRAPTNTQAATKPSPISTATDRIKPAKINTEAVEVYSGLRITDRTISMKALDQEMEGRQIIQLRQMDRVPRDTFTNKEIDWVTIGVVTRKTLSKPAVNGSTFMVWGLSDLNGTKLGVFLFGDAYACHWKEVTGSIVAVLNATLLPATEKNKFAFKVTHPTEIVKLGKAVDFGICKGTTLGEARCRLAINTAKTQYCLHHVAANFMRAGRERQQLNNSTASLRKTPFAGLAKPKNLSAGVYTSAIQNSSQSEFNPISNKKRKRNDAGGVLGVPTVLTASGAVIQRGKKTHSTLSKLAHNTPSEKRGPMSLMEQLQKPAASMNPVRNRLDSGPEQANQPSRRAHKIVSAILRKDRKQLQQPKTTKVNMIHFMNTGVQVKK